MAVMKARVVLDLNTRVKVIQSIEQDKLSVKDVMKMFNIGKTQVYQILKMKVQIMRLWESCASGNIKRINASKTANEDVNMIVWEWFTSLRSKNHHVTGPMIQDYAKMVAQELGKTEFKASNGWLESFRKRHRIRFKEEPSHEPNDAQFENTEQWVTELPYIIEGYPFENIANCDETGLFFRALPNSVCFKGETCSSGNWSDERLTLFLCGFMSGEMEKPLVIGKPQCFETIDMSQLPVEWRSNEDAWMTAQIMEGWLLAFNDRMKKQNRHVLLFFDNATCHPYVELSNVKLSWFPPNTPSDSQPINKGVVQTVKLHYRKLFLQSLLANMSSASSASELARNVSVADAVVWIGEAIKMVSSAAVTKGFERAGFPTEVLTSAETDNDLQDLQSYMERVCSDCNAEDYINIDKDVLTEAVAYNAGVLGCSTQDSREEEEESILPSHETDECKVKTYQDALKSLKDLQQFFLQQNDSELYNAICQVKITAESRAAKCKPCKDDPA